MFKLIFTVKYFWIGEMSFEGMERQFWNQNFNSDSTKSEYSNFESQVFLSQIAIQLLRIMSDYVR
jgi:hypothetical protein